MMGVLIADNDVEWALRQSPGRRQPAKSGADGDDARAAVVGVEGGHDIACLSCLICSARASATKPTTMLASPRMAKFEAMSNSGVTTLPAATAVAIVCPSARALMKA